MPNSAGRKAPFLTLPPGGRAPENVWWLSTTDGVRLRAALWRADAPIAHVVMFSGRTEYLEKMAIPAAELVARGFSVVSVDWRGQGLSERLVHPPLKGHVDDFVDYQHDIDALLADPRVASMPGPRLVLAHSMGGVIATSALRRREIANAVDATVLSAPMFGIAMDRRTRAAAWLMLRVGLALNMRHRWPPFGDMTTPYVLQDLENNVLTGDQDVWTWLVETAETHPALGVAMPTLGWFAAANREMRRLRDAEALPGPMLCLRGGEEAVVDPAAIERVAARMGMELIDIPGGRHEVLIEAQPVRQMAWSAIDDFLQRHGLTPRISGA